MLNIIALCWPMLKYMLTNAHYNCLMLTNAHYNCLMLTNAHYNCLMLTNAHYNCLMLTNAQILPDADHFLSSCLLQ